MRFLALALFVTAAPTTGRRGVVPQTIETDVDETVLLAGASDATSVVDVTAAAANPSWQDQVDNLHTWDYGRITGLGIIVLIMTMNYGVPVFGNQSQLVSTTRINIANPDTNHEEVWKNTHSTGKIAAIQMGVLWVLVMAIRSIVMLGMQPNCNQTLCKSVAFIMASWQPVWYVGMLGRVDDVGGFQRDWKFMFQKETIMEMVLGAVFVWLGWFTEAPVGVPVWQEQWDSLASSSWDIGRLVVIGLIALIMLKNYVIPIWGTHSNLIEFLLPTDDAIDRAEVWNNYHSNVKIAAIEMAALWGQFAILSPLVMIGFQPNCVRAVIQYNAVMFVCWWPVWFLACLGRVDENDEAKRDVSFYVKKEVSMEIVLFIIFAGLGFFAP